MEMEPFLSRFDVPCCHLLHNQAVIDNSGMLAEIRASRTVTAPSNHKSCRICHLNSREIKCNLSDTTGGAQRQPRSDKI